MKHRILYLPVETKARELPGKLLLASKAVEKGWMVVIGEMTKVERVVLRYPAGAYVEISIPEKKAGNLAAYQALGHRTLNLCEENIVYISGKDYCNRKVGPSALTATDVLFTPGLRNEEDLRKYRPEGVDKMCRVGNPRFDTLRPDLRAVYQKGAVALQNRFGKFLLVNTNFAYVNNCFKPGDNYVGMLSRRGMIADEAHAEFKRREVDRKRRQLEEFRIVLAKIARSKEFDNIIVRPHPSENHVFWEWARSLGMEIRYEDTANTWMLAAEAILHTGCTTGIEGLLMDKPVATFLPDPGNEFFNQADEVSEPVGDARSFLDYAGKLRCLAPAALHTGLREQRAVASKYICNVSGPLSADRIVGSIDSIDVPELTTKQAGFNLAGALKESVSSKLGRFIRRERVGDSTKQKFPGLCAREINSINRQWHESGVLERVPRVMKFCDDVYIITES